MHSCGITFCYFKHDFVIIHICIFRWTNIFLFFFFLFWRMQLLLVFFIMSLILPSPFYQIHMLRYRWCKTGNVLRRRKLRLKSVPWTHTITSPLHLRSPSSRSRYTPYPIIHALSPSCIDSHLSLVTAMEHMVCFDWFNCQPIRIQCWVWICSNILKSF